MSCKTDFEVRKREITAIVNEIVAGDHALHGLGVTDYSERADAIDILNRIERRIKAGMK
jgi:hypothetical protein